MIFSTRNYRPCQKFQLPVVLCHLQGKTLVEAAQELGWAHGTVASRLSRARDLLRQRLTRRGVTLTATALGMALAEAAAPAAVPAILAASTVKAAVLFAAGTPFVSAAAILAEGVLRTLFMSKFKVGVCLVLALEPADGPWRSPGVSTGNHLTRIGSLNDPGRCVRKT